jgi:hypothetical protein
MELLLKKNGCHKWEVFTGGGDLKNAIDNVIGVLMTIDTTRFYARAPREGSSERAAKVLLTWETFDMAHGSYDFDSAPIA